MRILVLRREAPERDALAATLADPAAELYLVASVEDARARVAEIPPIDVALLHVGAAAELDDLLALTRELRDGRELASGTKVVLLADPGALGADERARVLAWGVDALLARSFEREELLSIVRTLARLRLTELTLLERAGRLVELNRRKDEFLAMLGHELRNPLSGIAAAMSVVRASGEDAAMRDRALGVIERQSATLRRLVDDLLDVARVTRGAFELRREPLDLGLLVAQVSGDLEQQAGRVGARRLSVSAPAKRAWIHADPARVVQVVANLLDNALKHTTSQGRVDVAVSCDAGVVELRVRDDGAGIPADALPRLFEPFYQVSPSIDRRAGGLGLGLALVRRIAELHGGGVEARSEGPGQGSTFVVRLPAIEPPADAEARQTPVPSLALRVLYVEDDADVAWSLEAQLASWGHEVTHVADGITAIELAASTDESDAPRFDVALVDIGLPGADGYEVAQAWRARSPRTVLVALTGYGNDEHVRRSAQAGFVRHLVKPVELGSLERLLAHVARRG